MVSSFLHHSVRNLLYRMVRRFYLLMVRTFYIGCTLSTEQIRML